MTIRAAARARIIASVVVLASLPALTGASAAADRDSGVRLDFIGERELPNAMAFQGTTVGGLSAISYDAKTDSYYVISDDRSQTAPARFYTARLDFADSRRTVVLVSDDNFSAIEVTQFIAFAAHGI